MGKGDIKTAKGKRVNGSYGNARKRKSVSTVIAAPKAKAEKKEVVKKEPAAKKPAVKKEAAQKATTAKKTTKK